jgi:hypothetical protein
MIFTLVSPTSDGQALFEEMTDEPMGLWAEMSKF